MDDSLARRAKRRAAQRRITFTRLVEEAIREYLRKPLSTELRPKIVLPVAGDPTRKLKWEDVQRAIEQQEFEDDLLSLGLEN